VTTADLRNPTDQPTDDGVTVRDLTVRGGRLHTRVHVKGDGPPLLYLHGLLGINWGTYLNALTERFTVFAPEYPGTTPGYHQDVYAIHDMLDLSVFYDDIVSALGIESAVVVGESVGAMIALEYASLFPAKVEQLVCAAPYGLWRAELPIGNYGEHAIEHLPPVLSADPESPEVASCFPFGEQDRERFTDRAVALTWNLGVATKFLWPIPERGLERRIHRVAAPVQLVWGSADRIVPSGYAAEFKARLADASVDVIDGAGHTVLYDAADVAVAATLEFISRTAPATSP
jgi:pimeloyl-ACP methyl ester carboxylesterase